MPHTPSVRISVVIPCYRSRETLPVLVRGLHEELPKIATEYEIILVVDGSPDDTTRRRGSSSSSARTPCGPSCSGETTDSTTP